MKINEKLIFSDWNRLWCAYGNDLPHHAHAFKHTKKKKKYALKIEVMFVSTQKKKREIVYSIEQFSWINILARTHIAKWISKSWTKNFEIPNWVTRTPNNITLWNCFVHQQSKIRNSLGPHVSAELSISWTKHTQFFKDFFSIIRHKLISNKNYSHDSSISRHKFYPK